MTPERLFLDVQIGQSDGWVAGEDGVRHALRAGEAAFIRRGEIHSKGSESGVIALMVQVREFDLHMR
jgi:hypothetical protein